MSCSHLTFIEKVMCQVMGLQKWERRSPSQVTGAQRQIKRQFLLSAEKGKHTEPKKCYPTQTMQEGFFGGEESPLLWKGKQSQAEEPKVPGEGNNGISGRARASLKAKESDVFVELEVAQCGWSAREVRHGSGEWLDYRSTCVKPTKLIFQDYVREWAVIFLLPLCQGQQTFL